MKGLLAIPAKEVRVGSLSFSGRMAKIPGSRHHPGTASKSQGAESTVPACKSISIPQPYAPALLPAAQTWTSLRLRTPRASCHGSVGNESEYGPLLPFLYLSISSLPHGHPCLGLGTQAIGDQHIYATLCWGHHTRRDQGSLLFSLFHSGLEAGDR